MVKEMLVCSCVLGAVAQSALGMMPSGHEWEQEQNLSLNKEPARTWAWSFQSIDNALKILPEHSEYWKTLDSKRDWAFMWSKDPMSRPVDFYKPEFDVSKWDRIVVPCSWQAMGANADGKGGYGTPIYTNQPYPFKRDWPFVMGEPPKYFTNYEARNPVGSYRRDFEVPANWTEGRDVYIQFEGVDSFFYLFINGQYVGFSKDSRNPAAFNISKYLNKSGKNMVAVEVYRNSDASYLECQDMFRLSGIFRGVSIYALPKLHIRDFFAIPEPKGDINGDWTITVDVELENLRKQSEDAHCTIEAQLFDAQGKFVAPMQPKDAPWDGISSKKLNVTAQRKYKTGLLMSYKTPALWSAEIPNLYTLVLTLRDAQGNVIEHTSSQFGFRKVEIRNARFFVNGKKIKLKGVNRHETEPMMGHTVSRAMQLKEVRLLKEGNINHVRNSHYTPDAYFYFLCNKYGIYLEDEANIESHGYFYGKESISHPVEWLDAHVTRIMNMVERNKNQPSVLIWSLGNEAGPGRNFLIAEKTIKARDRSRVTHYERNNAIVDLGSNQYPGVGWVQWKANDKNATQPFYISEYAHNMMNALGNFKDYQDAIESSDVIMGGAIWDWVDQALWMKNKDGVNVLAYGGDFGDFPNDGQFVCNGTILADRQVEPGYYEVKFVYQNIKTTLAGNQLHIFNKNYFRDLSAYQCSWQLLEDGVAIKRGEITLPNIAPQQIVTVALPTEVTQLSKKPECEYSLRMSYTLKHAEKLCAAGYEVASDSLMLQAGTPKALVDTGDTVKQTRNGTLLTFSNKKFTATFDLAAGTLINYVVDGLKIINAPFELDATRCPSSNEAWLSSNWFSQGLRAFNYAPVTLDALGHATVISPEALAVEVKSGANGASVFNTSTRALGQAVESLRDYGSGGTATQLVKVGNTTERNTHFIVNTQWSVYPDGSIVCQSAYLPRGKNIELARVGTSVELPGSFKQVRYFARGPFENYPDRKAGAFPAQYTTTTDAMVVPYCRPQDTGVREEARWVELTNAQGKGIVVASIGEDFAFSAIPYTTTDLLATKHSQELGTSDKTVLTILGASRGLGGASCGPGPLDRDIIRANKPYTLGFVLRPATAANCTKVAVPAAKLDMTMPPPPETYTVVECTSQEPGNEGQKACDGDPDTIWHSQYGVTLGKYPHAITIDLRKTIPLKGITCQARQDGANGMIKGFRVEVSTDRKTWTVVKEGELARTPKVQKVNFNKTVSARYVRFTGLSEQNGQEFASMAEIGFIK